MTFTLTTPQFEQFAKKLTKLNTRATKCETEPLTIVGQPSETVIEIELGNGLKRYIPGIRFELSGEVPRIAGFEFLATVTHTEAGNIIGKAPGARGLDLESFRLAGPKWCDHCQKNRARSETFIVRGPEGALLRVGRNCLADFLRTGDVSLTVALLALLRELSEQSDEFGGDGFGGGYTSIKEYLACAVAATRQWGFIKSGNEKSTRSQVQYLLNGPGKRATPDELADWLKARPNDSDKSIAEQVRAWGRVQGGTEFGENLAVACALEYAHPKSQGLLAAAPYCFDRELAPKREGYRPFSDEWLGVTGQRVKGLRVKVIKSTGTYTDFGYVTFYTLQDLDSGACLNWKASGEPPLGDDPGRVVTIDGTIKGHDTFRGVKQTRLTRCKVKTKDNQENEAE